MMFGQIAEPRTRGVALIDADPARAEMFALMLGTRDLQVVAQFSSVTEALASPALPELTLLNTSGIDQAVLSEVTRLRGGAQTAILLLVAETEPDHIEEALGAGADHVLPVGFQADRFSAAAAGAMGVYRQRQDQAQALSRAEAALSASKTMFRAKAILIARHTLTEQDAHQRLQQMSMKRNVPIADMARQIVDAEDLLC